MRRFLKTLLLLGTLPALLAIGLGGYWYWYGGGPGSLAREVGAGTQAALQRWGQEHPELAASLRRHLAEAAGRPDATLSDLHQGIDTWLGENAEELARWQGLTLAEDEDDLVRILELRRGLARKLGEVAAGEAGGAPAPGDASAPGTLEIRAGDELAGQVGEAHQEPGLSLTPGDAASP